MEEKKGPLLSRRQSRRGFLGLMVLATAGASAAILEKATQPVGVLHAARWLLRGQSQRLATEPSVVSLAECPSYDASVLDCLSELWHEAGMPDVAGRRVLVKPNLIDFSEDHPVTSDPAVVGAVLDLLAELGADQVVVGDGSGFRREAGPIVDASGLAAVLSARSAKFVDLNYDDPRPVAVRDGWFPGLKELWLPRHVREAELIVSIPKVKTHHWAGVSLSLKNLFGVVPGTCYGWPKNVLHINGIPLSILGLYQIVRPVVAVADGIVGMEGDGPLFGVPVQHGLLAVGRDPVAVDMTCAQLMGLSSDDIPHLWLAGWTGLGQGAEIAIRGVSTERLQRQYQLPPSI
ncbi:DUF362 domain-containing protein [Chloroflexota bacterium]